MAQLVEQQLENLLGTDYIDVVIQQGNESFLSTVRRAGNYGFTLCNWGADYSDASAYVVDPFAEDSSYSFIYESDDPETQSFYQEYLDLVETGLAPPTTLRPGMRPSPRRSASCWTTASPSPFTPHPGVLLLQAQPPGGLLRLLRLLHPAVQVSAHPGEVMGMESLSRPTLR